MSLNGVFSFLFSQGFARLNLPPLGGLALANSTATALETAGLLVLMRRKLDGLQSGYILRAVGAATGAALVMGAGLWLWTRFGAGLHNGLLVAGGIGLGGLVYAALLVALQIEEVRSGWAWLSAKLKIIRAPGASGK
jgi:putative peptidoglycan lipid II flippase